MEKKEESRMEEKHPQGKSLRLNLTVILISVS